MTACGGGGFMDPLLAVAPHGMTDLIWERGTGGTWTLQPYEPEAWDNVPVVGRTSYRRLAKLPAFGLFAAGELVATVRAETAIEARDLFKQAGLQGDRVRRLPLDNV